MTKIREKWQRKMSGQENKEEKEEKVGSRIRQRLLAN